MDNNSTTLLPFNSYNVQIKNTQWVLILPKHFKILESRKPSGMNLKILVTER